MIHIVGKEKTNGEMLLKAYGRKLDRTRLLKRLKHKQQFRKPCEIRKETQQKAIMRERYKREHGLI